MTKPESKQRERRFIPEFVDAKFPDRVAVFYNVAVGPAPDELYRLHPEVPLEYFRRWRFWIDAVVILQNKLILFEGKIRNPAAGLGQLLLYRALLPQTPELAPYKNRLVEMHLVTARPDPRIMGVAATLGITVHVYSPAWVTDYLREINMYTPE